MYSSSSSDDDMSAYTNKNAGGGGQSAMMAARRQALQKQREEQQRQQNEDRRPKTAGRLGSNNLRSESDVPTEFLEDAHANEVSAPTPTPPAALSKQETIESLQRDVEIKKQLLHSTKEKEQALINKWRTEKAQKTAEIRQLDSQLRTLWGTIDDEKVRAERSVQTKQDEHEREMRNARQEVERTAKGEFEEQINGLKAKLQRIKEEEERLQSLLDTEGETKDVVQHAVGSAVSKILDKIQSVFAQSSGETDEWDASLKKLISHEVRSSFAVRIDSEAATEREELQRQFDEMLSFWGQTEAQEREQIVKMDDALLADLENMTHEDMNRLHNEELMMEELYVQAREAWALEHQKILQKEVDAAMRRRQEEIEEQRTLRHQLHVDRLQDIETRHKEQLEAETKMHEVAMQQLREHFAREEQLQDDRNRLLLSTEQDVARATGSFQSVLTSIEGVMRSLKDFKGAMEDSHRQLATEREASLEDRRAALETVKDLAAAQCVSIEGERQKLGDTLMQLELLKGRVEKEMNDKVTWLAQQEAVYKGNHEEWERSYRRWTQQVQSERRMAEQRFREALTTIQSSLSLLTQEENAIVVESKSLQSAFAQVSETVDREVARLEQKQTDLAEQQSKMSETLADMEKEKEASLQQWRQLKAERATVTTAKEELRQEEQTLQQMSYALEVARRQVEAAYCHTAEMTEMLTPSVLSSFHLHLQQQQQQQQQGDQPQRGKKQVLHGLNPEQSNGKKPSAPPKKDRLPQQVLAALRKHLDGVPSSTPYMFPAGDFYTQPHRQASRRVDPPRATQTTEKRASYHHHQQQHHHHHDPVQSPIGPAEGRRTSSLPTGSEFNSPSTLTTFTNLVNFSDDNDGTSTSLSKF